MRIRQKIKYLLSANSKGLEKGMATHSSILAWRIPWTEDLAGYSLWGCKELDTTERLTHTTVEDTFYWALYLKLLLFIMVTL